MLRQHFDLRWYAWSLAAAAHAYAFLGQFDESVEEARKTLSVAEEHHDNSLISFAEFCLSVAYTFKGDATTAIEHAQMSVDKAPTPADKVWGQTFLGWAWCRAGRAQEGADLLASILPLYEGTQLVLGQVWMAAFLGEAYWRAGRIEEAERTLQKGLELAIPCRIKMYIGWIHRLLGEVALAKNPEQVTEPLAAPHFKTSIAVLRDIKAENELALAYAGFARLHKVQGRLAEARDYFIRALEIFERLGTLIEPNKVRSELAEFL